MKWTRIKTIFAIAVLSCSAISAFAESSHDNLIKGLVSDYWFASGRAENRAQSQLVSIANSDVSKFYNWLRAGPVYPDGVAVGVQHDTRYRRGTRFQYMYVVPDSYDPQKSYPVEFLLHGGVSREEPRSKGEWWLGGEHYDKYRQLEQITVFPSSWYKVPWWGTEQTENLVEILTTLKKTYNIDDNKVFLSGVSDGGTGAFYFAFTQPTQWAAFLPYIGHLGVLIAEEAIRGGSYEFENLTNSRFYIVNGTDDSLYPVSKVQPYINVLEKAGVEHEFIAIEGGGHNLKWLAAEQPNIDSYKDQQVRDPLPETLRWSTDDVKNYGRIHWLQIDKLERSRTPGWISAERHGNTFLVYSVNVEEFSLLLHPEEVDFSQNIIVVENDVVVFDAKVSQSIDTLFKWAERRDKTQLFTAELSINLSE